MHGQPATAKRPPLTGAAAADLVAALRDDNMFWRERAQRRFVDRGATRPDGGRDVVPALLDLVGDAGVDAVGLNPGAIHAIWMLRQLGALEGPHAEPLAIARVQSALLHPSAGVRLNAVKALPRDAGTLHKLAGSNLASDPAPLVRLAVLESLGEWPPAPEAGAIVMSMLADPRTLADPVLADAATAAAAVQADHVLPALLSAPSPTDRPPPPAIAIVERVSEHVARGADGRAVAAAVVRLPHVPQPVAAAALSGLVRGWPKARPATLGAEAEAALWKLAESLPTELQGQVMTLAGNLGSKADDARIARIVAALTAALDNASAGRSAAPEAAGVILDTLGSFTPQLRTVAVRTVLAKRDWAALLVERLERKSVPLSDIGIADQARLTEHPDVAVRDRARRVIASGGDLLSVDRQRVIDEILPVVAAGGDATSGKVIFKEQCGKCHVHSGEGGKVGPELTGMAVHPAHELLVHILDPNRSVEGNYRAYTVSTEDGRVVTGLLASESRTAIEIVDAEGKRMAIYRSEIDEFRPSPNSLMPVGFEKQITPRGFADLLTFLTKRGKFRPLELGNVATAVSTKGMFHDAASAVERLVFADWGPKQVQGVPFSLVDPQGQAAPNVVMLHGPLGMFPPKMRKSVTLAVESPVRAVHILGGVAGWGVPASEAGTKSMVVRLVYADGAQEDHVLVNGRHIADYIRRVDVPESAFAFDLDGRQLRYIRVEARRAERVSAIEFVKGDDGTAPIVMAVTVETP